MKKIISIDLDGVLNTYSGNYVDGEIPSVRDGAYEFLKALSEDYTIEIYTVREIELVKEWLVDNNLIDIVSDVTNVKNKFSTVMLDDRAINFDGNFSTAYEKIVNFKPYWK